MAVPTSGGLKLPGHVENSRIQSSVNHFGTDLAGKLTERYRKSNKCKNLIFIRSVMPVAFSDSDWERINYEEDSPIMEKSARAITEIIDEDGIGPCEMSEEDILFGSDDEDANNLDFRHSGKNIHKLGMVEVSNITTGILIHCA